MKAVADPAAVRVIVVVLVHFLVVLADGGLE
jgi:hypothetical protein